MVRVLVLHGVEAGNTAHAVERYAVLRQEVGDHRRRRNPPSQALLHVEGKRFNMAQLPQIQRDGAVDLPVCLIIMGAHAAAIPIAVQYLAAAVIAVCQAVEDALLFFADRCILGGRVKVRTGASISSVKASLPFPCARFTVSAAVAALAVSAEPEEDETSEDTVSEEDEAPEEDAAPEEDETSGEDAAPEEDEASGRTLSRWRMKQRKTVPRQRKTTRFPHRRL